MEAGADTHNEARVLTAELQRLAQQGEVLGPPDVEAKGQGGHQQHGREQQQQPEHLGGMERQ